MKNRVKNGVCLVLVFLSLVIISSSCKKDDRFFKKDPVITWANPSDIYFGTSLSAEQLNATVDVHGTFVYTPGIGTKLNEGKNQDLRVDFIPTDFETYNSATKIVKINVLPPITVTDIDGNTYKTVTIGKQVWMAENLKVTRYRNGDNIPRVTDYQWWYLATGALCEYNNDPYLGNKYGKLYNWYAVNDSRKLAPAGWHIPTEAEWKELENYIESNPGISGSIAKALASQTEWTYDNHGGAVGNNITINNSSGFSALPTGYLHDGSFKNFGNGTCFWSADEYDQTTAWRRYLGYVYNNLGSYNFDKADGFSVRCVKD